MENMFVWMLIFAAAAMGLLGTFLFASERELKVKRREVAELEARLVDNDAESPVGESADTPRTDTQASAELSARNTELLQQVSSLSSQLDASQKRTEELEAAQRRMGDMQLEHQKLRAANQKLQNEMASLKTELQASQTKPSELDNHSVEANDRQSQLRAENAALRETLDATQARALALEAAAEPLAEVESREMALRDQRQEFETQFSDLTRELAAEREKLRELDATRSRLTEMERHNQQMRDESRRREDEISRLQERSAESDDNQRRLRLLRKCIGELQAKQAALTERSRQILEDLAVMARMIDVTPEDRLLTVLFQDKSAFHPTPYGRPDSDVTPTVIHLDNSDDTDSDSQQGASEDSSATTASANDVANNSSAGTSIIRRWGFGIFPVVIGVVAVAGFLSTGSLRTPSKGQVKGSPAPSLTPSGGSNEVSSQEDLSLKASPSSTNANGASPENPAQPPNREEQAAGAQNQSVPASGVTLQKPGKDSIAAKTNDRSPQPAPMAAKPAQALKGRYEIVRPTQVYSEPSEDSRLITNVDPGIQVNVVDDRNGWLEIRSKHGRPPGFIKKEAAARMRRN